MPPDKNHPPVFALLAGEASGDAQGALLVEAIRKREPWARFVGVGGVRMKSAGVELLYNSAEWGSIGVIESLKLYAPLSRAKKQLVRRFTETRPDLLIPIDFGYFNLRVAGAVHSTGVPVLYYFPPKSWSRTGTVSELMRTSVDAVATPFPWSAERTCEAGIPVSFVGHPLLDSTQHGPDRAALCREWDLDHERPVVGLLPGSRGHEVKYLWPQLVGAASLAAKQTPGVQFVVPAAPGVDREFLKRVMDQSADSPHIHLVDGRTSDVLTAADVAAVCSGTAALEAATRFTPMVILYGGSWLMTIEWAYRKPKLKLPFIGMPNLMAERAVVPELIGEDAKAPRIAEELLSLLQNKERAAQMRSELKEVVRCLGLPGAAERTASIALQMARGKCSPEILAQITASESLPFGSAASLAPLPGGA